MAGVHEPPGHRRGALDRELERGKRVREHSPTDMQMDRVEREIVVASGREGVVELFDQDAELGRPAASRVRSPGFGVRGGSDAGVDADADRGARRAAAPPVELREQVEVHVDAGVEQRVDIGGRQVRPGEADLLHRPAVLERVVHLAGRTRVDPDGAQATDEREHLRVPLGLQREPESNGTPARSNASIRPRACSSIRRS